MARPGVTYQDIATAASQLKGQGKNITIENVRVILGTGSIGTINNHLRKWKEIQNSTDKIATKENLPAELVSLIKGLWETMIAQTSEQFIPIENKLHSEIVELKEEVEKYKNNNQRWQKLFNQWQQDKTQLANERLSFEQALEFSQKENTSLHTKQDGLLQQLHEKQERIDELYRLHKQAQENLEHYRDSSREQRLIEQQQFEQQKQQLQSEIKIISDQMIAQQDKISILQQNNQSLQHANTNLEKDYSKMEMQHEKMKIAVTESEKKYHEHLYASETWHRQYNESQKIINDQANQLIDSQAENKTLLREVSGFQKNLAQSHDQLKLLDHEKWTLAQEKAQLEGQLKQMQKLLVV